MKQPDHDLIADCGIWVELGYGHRHFLSECRACRSLVRIVGIDVADLSGEMAPIRTWIIRASLRSAPIGEPDQGMA